MKILCFVKFTPNVEDFVYNPITNVLERENSKMILNPDDAAALGLAIKIKNNNPNVTIEVATMGPQSVSTMMKDILRLGIEKGVMLTDKLFAGSDTYATSKILATYAKKTNYDVIFTGSHTLDGDTAHVPSQIAEWLDLEHCSYICDLDKKSFLDREVLLTSSQDNKLVKISMPLPAVISIQKEIGIKLPFVRYADLKLNVDDRLAIYSAQDLGLGKNDIGFEGSKTKVVKTFVKQWGNKDREIIQGEKAGAEVVYKYLQENGFIGGEDTYG